MIITLVIKTNSKEASKKIMRELDDYILGKYDVEQVIVTLKQG